MSCKHWNIKRACCSNCGLKYELCADGKMRRTTLPATIHQRRSHENAFLSFVKRLIGLELTKAGFPISFFDAATWLQRSAEQMEYTNKLRHANDIESPVERMASVIAVFVSMIATLVNSDRVMAINPILGETFELCRPDLGFRIILEQISHHPPCIAVQFESVNMKGEPDGICRGFANAMVKATFWGRTVEIFPRGFYTLELPQRGEAYTFTMSLVKIIVGNLWRGMERFSHRFDGEVNVYRYLLQKPAENDNEKLSAFLKFHSPTQGTSFLGGWDEFSDPAWADGYIQNGKGDKLLHFYGKYNFEFYSVPTAVWESAGGWKELLSDKRKCERKNEKVTADKKVDHSAITGLSPTGVALFDFALPGQTLLWRKEPLPASSLDYFKMTKFSMQMNEFAHVANLPPTDTRLRKDILALENGDIDTAEKEKYLIEEKQRTDLRKRIAKYGKKAGDPDPWMPIWFRKGPHPYLATLSDSWLFTGDYYKRDWSECPDLGFQPILELSQ